MPSIGPALPPHLAQRSPSPEIGPQTHVSARAQPPQQSSSQDGNEDEEDGTCGPSIPPHMLKSAKQAAPLPQPSRPPVIAAEDDSDDDDIGPQPLPSSRAGVDTKADAVRRFMEAEERRAKEIEAAKKPKAPTRDEWMLVPPSASDLLGNLDPSKLTKARQFSRSTAPAKNTDNSLWTETPAERQQRIADEVSGRKRKATSTAEYLTPEEESERRKKKKLDAQIRQGAEEYTRQVRGAALVDAHAAKMKATPEDSDSQSAIWDHSRDMAVGGRLMDDSARSKMLKDAKGLGDRFSTGKSGGYV